MNSTLVTKGFKGSETSRRRDVLPKNPRGLEDGTRAGSVTVIVFNIC
jgi:hypothetical protein